MNPVNDQLKKIERELTKLDRRRVRLLAEREELTTRGIVAPLEIPVFEMIQQHPGISRSGILTKLEVEPSRTEMTNTLTKLRRRGQIVNFGTKKRPGWYAVQLL